MIIAFAAGFFWRDSIYEVKNTSNDIGYNRDALLIGKNEILVEVADTELLQSVGLSGRDYLGENEGMLFVFDISEQYAFWMKDMRFPIDIIWISEDKKVADITKNLTPESYPAQYTPIVPVSLVIEVNSGWVDGHDVKIGDMVTLPDFD